MAEPRAKGAGKAPVPRLDSQGKRSKSPLLPIAAASAPARRAASPLRSEINPDATQGGSQQRFHSVHGEGKTSQAVGHLQWFLALYPFWNSKEQQREPPRRSCARSPLHAPCAWHTPFVSRTSRSEMPSHSFPTLHETQFQRRLARIIHHRDLFLCPNSPTHTAREIPGTSFTR